MRVIAIDGPAGAGKSTVAKRVSEATGLPYLDTGAMYRCVAFAIQRGDVEISDEAKVGQIAHSAVINIEGVTATLNGEDVTSLIRSPEINAIVSVIAAQSPVRDAMREQQRRWIDIHGGGVIEGRDIGTVVFPEAILKIFLTASPQVRAERRVGQSGGNLEEVAAAIEQRDHIDSNREDSPLRPSHDSVAVDSSNKSIDQVVTEITDLFALAETRRTNG